MPKYKIVCLILAVVIAITGTVLVIINLGGDEIPPIDVIDEDLNTYLDAEEGDDVGNPDADAIRILFISHKALLNRTGFKGVSKGTSSAVGIKQNVLNTRYVVGDFANKRIFKEMVTKGIVSSAYQLYLVGNNYIYRASNKVRAVDDIVWSSTAQSLTKQAFYNSFGHRSDKLAGYILNEDTVLRGEFVSEINGLYQYHYVLDTVEATTYLRREMITNGNLSAEPTFSKCEFYLTIDKNFNIQSLRTDCEYKAKTAGINATCKEDITETFYDYEGDLPNSDFFGDYLNQEPGEDLGKTETALDVLLDMFSPYLQGEDLQVELGASVNGDNLDGALLSISGLDISDLSKLTVNAKIGNYVKLCYLNSEEKVYLQYQNFKASTTVGGIAEFAGAIAALLGEQDADSSFEELIPADFDIASVLEELTYSVSEDGVQCIVTLPLNLAGMEICVNFYADVVDGAYNFTHATVSVNDVQINITLRKWTVEEPSGVYPEILGLVDLISNGKLSLNADVKLPIGDRFYNVNADMLVDLATRNLAINATLGNNGVLTALLVDDVVYVAFGELKFKLDVTNVDSLLELVTELTGETPSVNMPQVSLDNVLCALMAITVTEGSDGTVSMQLALDEIDLSVNLADVNGRWQVVDVVIEANGVKATITPAESQDEVTAPADTDAYADVTELMETFANPILDILHGESFGTDFAVKLTVGDKYYGVTGSVAVDIRKTLHLTATIWDGDVGIIDADVIYADGTVFLTVNGVKVAFAVDGGSGDTDIVGALAQLAENEQLKQLLQEREEITRLTEDIAAVVDAAANFQLIDLLDVDLTAIVTHFGFVDGELAFTLSGSAFDCDWLSLDVALFTDNGRLGVRLGEIEIEDASLQLEVIVNVDVECVTIPSTDDYVLNLHGEVMGAELDISVDFMHLDVWASVRYNDDIVHLRYVENKLYVTYFELAAVFDSENLVDAVNTIIELLGVDTSVNLTESANGLDEQTIAAILALFNVNLTGKNPCISLAYGDFNLSVNFVNAGGVLQFDSVTATVLLDGSEYVAKLTQQSAQAHRIDISGDFFDGNLLVEDFIDMFKAYGVGEEGQDGGPISHLINTNSWKLDFSSDSYVTVDGETYRIAAGSYVALYYDGTGLDNLQLRAKLDVFKFNSESGEFDAEFIYLDVLYIDGRIYATYDSRKNDGNENELKVTVSVDAIMECIDLLPSLAKVVPQLGDMMDSLTNSTSQSQDELNVSTLYEMFNEITYNKDSNVFTAKLNSGITSKLGEVFLSVQPHGDALMFNELRLEYDNVSIQLNGVVLSGSPSIQDEDGNKTFDFVGEDILSYFTTNGGAEAHMNLDSIRELLAAFVITADNEDEDGNRSFALEGTINATLLGNKATIGITIVIDIDSDNNVYLAVKLDRSASGLLSGAIYADNGGYSYALLNGKESTISLYRNSYNEWCSNCKKVNCSWGLLHSRYRSNKLDTELYGAPSYAVNLTLEEFTADTATMVGYILDVINFGSLIDSQIRNAIGQGDDEDGNVYGIEDVLKSYTYNYDEVQDQGIFAISTDLSPIDGALGALNANIVHVGNLRNVYCDDDGNLQDYGNAKLTQINGNAELISIASATFVVNLMEPTSGLAYQLVTEHNYMW